MHGVATFLVRALGMCAGAPPGVIQSLSSYKCIDLPGGDTTNGNVLWQWDCVGTFNQQWIFDGNGQLTFAWDTSKCVDLLGGDSSNGNQLGLWDCAGTPQQQWWYDDSGNAIHLSSSTGADATKCIDLPYGDNMAPIQIWDCDGYDAQLWSWSPMTYPSPSPTPSPGPSGAGTIVNTETGLCLDLPGGYAYDGNQLWAWNCQDSDSQKWHFDNGNIVYAADPSQCVDIFAGNFENGQQLQVWQCLGTPQQQFGYDQDSLAIFASSSADASKCIQMRDASGMAGTVVEIWSCLPYGTQKWQFQPLT